MRRETFLGIVDRGEPAEFVFFVFDNGRPDKNIVSRQVRIGVLLPNTSAPLIEKSTGGGVVQRSNGTILVTLDPEETQALQPGTYEVQVLVSVGDPPKPENQFRGTMRVEESMV